MKGDVNERHEPLDTDEHFKPHIMFADKAGLYYKTLRIFNLQKTDRFSSTLLTFGLDKYTQARTNTLGYCGVHRLRIRNAGQVIKPLAVILLRLGFLSY